MVGFLNFLFANGRFYSENGGKQSAVTVIFFSDTDVCIMNYDHLFLFRGYLITRYELRASLTVALKRAV
jgi:hypothetical protein